jgi:heme/copper-type cytochrome/quinol oxidase subunit 2
MDILVGVWVVITGIIMFFDGWFIVVDVDRLRRKTPSKKDRKELRIMVLVFFFAWAWPLLIPAGIGFLLWKAGVFVKDCYRFAFGREATDDPSIVTQQFIKPTGAELRRQQEMSRKAHAERIARKEARRQVYHGYKPASDDEQFIEMMRGHR